MLKVVSNSTDVKLSLDEVVREGARRMLISALELEVEEYIEANKQFVGPDGRRLVNRNGRAQERSITTSCGTIKVQAPRVHDQREDSKFLSGLLPRFLRKSPKIESLLPLLYLKGLSTGKIADTLSEHFGGGSMGLSASSISKLIRGFESEFEEWKKKGISSRYIYIWADGVNLKVRLGTDKTICLLVIIGVREDGSKELLGLLEGYRESKESWKRLLNSLVSRGFKAPLLAIADGALGFWSALREIEEFEQVREQRCWVHKIANILDHLPKRVQSEVKAILHEMMKAEKMADAEEEKKNFEKTFGEKYPKAVKSLDKDWDKLTTFFNFPAQHWQSIRTTNPIESSFATVKLRTKVTKGAGNASIAAALGFKLLMECEKTWRRIKGHQEIKKLLLGIEYKDGVMIPTQTTNLSDAAS